MSRGLESRIPPVALALMAGGLMWMAKRGAPGLDRSIPYSGEIGWLLTLAGVLICASGVACFRRAGTTVNPTKPGSSSALVVSGPYRFTRNPMYLGFLLMLSGSFFFLSNLLAVVLLPVFVWYMNRCQIGPEERALEQLFGRLFADYKGQVRRWL